MQIPYLARHCRVLTFDGRGNGRSDRPESGYTQNDFTADALAVMDATGTERATLVSLSKGAQWALMLAGDHPERVESAVFICPFVPLGESPRKVYPGATSSTPTRAGRSTTVTTGSGTTAGFLEFFFSQMFTEPHSTKPIEDCVGWGLETTPETLIATQEGGLPPTSTRELARA